MRKLALVLVALIVIVPSSLWADTAITLGSYSNFTNGAWTLGFVFTPTTPIVVTSLGSYFQNGVTTTHDAAIFTTGGAVLASASITGTGGPDGFAYTGITPLTLFAGTSYVVAANTLSDNYALDFTNSFTVGPFLTYNGHVEAPGVALTFPGGVGGNFGFDDFGGNFQYQPVPEPGSLMLLGSGLIGLGGIVRRKLSL